MDCEICGDRLQVSWVKTSLDGDTLHMSLWLRVPLTLAVAALAGLVAFVAVFNFVGSSSCPPEVRPCDLPMMAGVAFGAVAAPLAGLLAGWFTFRGLGRARRRPGPPAV